MKNCLSTIACFAFLSFLSCFPTTMAQDLSDGYLDRERKDAVTATVPPQFGSRPASQAPQDRYLPPSQNAFGNPQEQLPVAVAPVTRSVGPAWPAMSREVAESNAAVNGLIQKLRTAEQDEEKEDIKAKLKAELENQYDLYLDQHEVPLKQLEEKLAKLRKEFDWRKSARDDLVKLRLDTIWYNSQGLGWPGQNRNSFFGPSPFANNGTIPNASSFPRNQYQSFNLNQPAARTPETPSPAPRGDSSR